MDMEDWRSRAIVLLEMVFFFFINKKRDIVGVGEELWNEIVVGEFLWLCFRYLIFS